MKNRYWLFKRGPVFYLQDSVTGKQESLRTRDAVAAERLRLAKNEAVQNRSLSLALARAYLSVHDSQMSKRTWQPYSRLLIALRAELGELTGRFHFHYLLGGTQTRNEITLAHQMEHNWYGMLGALARCRAYDHSRAGVEYVSKCLSQGVLGKNEYELRKFNLSDTVTLSRSVFRVIGDLERMGADTRHARVTKRAVMNCSCGEQVGCSLTQPGAPD